jgi:hypothetical protein
MPNPPVVPPTETIPLPEGWSFDGVETSAETVNGVTTTTITLWRKLAIDRELVKTIRVTGAADA